MLCERCGVEIISVRDTASGLCYNCIEDDKKIAELRKDNHSHHCACGMVFGGQECMCNRKGDQMKKNLEWLVESIKSVWL